MSSSQQQSANSNNDRSQATNSRPQALYDYQMNDYLDDPSLPQSNPQTLDVNSGGTPDLTAESYSLDPINQQFYSEFGYYDNNYQEEDHGDSDDDIPSDHEAEIKAAEEMIRNAQVHDNNGDVALFSDDVQKAFEMYENENSKHWNRTESIWENIFSDEYDETLEQMHQCMAYMSQEYSTAEMPNDLIARSQESILNPDAVEFRPSWSSPATTTTTKTDKEAILVTSWLPLAARKQEEESHDS